jgi:hypothetical protein
MALKPAFLSFLFLTLSTIATSCGNDQRLPWDSKNDDSPNETSTEVPAAPTPNTPQQPSEVLSDNEEVSEQTKKLFSATISNTYEISKTLNLNTWRQRGGNCSNATIAIFDNGFEGLSDAQGLRLPPSVKIENAPGNKPQKTAHGTKLAELIWALCTGSSTYSPEKSGPTLLLFNTNGYTNLTHAVETVATSKDQIDMVVYSQVWEYGGNFDGKGFINELINRIAKENKTIWINAAGNYAKATWDAPLEVLSGGAIQLPFQTTKLRLVVTKDQTPVKITAAWSDFKDDKNHKTVQDIDLLVEDHKGQELFGSKLIQDGKDHQSEQGYSAHAREQALAILNTGLYYIRLTTKTPSAFSRSSRIRIAADGQDIYFVENTPQRSVMIPADNPNVLTVGASDFDGSSRGDQMASVTSSASLRPALIKPDFEMVSTVRFDKDLYFVGTSSAAAIAAATIAIHDSLCGRMTTTTWQKIAQQLKQASSTTPYPYSLLHGPRREDPRRGDSREDRREDYWPAPAPQPSSPSETTKHGFVLPSNPKCY